jgi:transcription elongation GreA/GreB family factor
MSATLEKAETLLLEAAENNNNAVYREILELIASIPEPIPQAIKDGISLIIEAWQLEPTESADRTNFLIAVAKFFKFDFLELRSALPAIIKKAIPKGFNKTTSIKSLGVRDNSLPLCNVYSRYLKLSILTEERLFFSSISNSWGKTLEIDWISGSIKRLNFVTNEINEVDLGVALKQSFFFTESEELDNIVIDKKVVSYKTATKILAENTSVNLTDEIVRNLMFYTYVPVKMTPAEFELWKIGKNESDEIGTIETARSIQELNKILVTNKELKKISDSELIRIKDILSLLRPTSAVNDVLLYTETIALLIKLLSIEEIKELIPTDQTLIDALWPDGFDPKVAGIKIWTDLKIVTLNLWAEFTKLVKGEDYLIHISSYLPWKAWPTIISKVNKDEIIHIFNSARRLNSPEALLWIWKNKASLPESLQGKINTINLFAALGRKKDGAIWNTAIRELKKLIIENEEFQLFLIKDKSNEADIIDFLERLNPLTSFTKTEKQSIIVKLSRKFPTMKDLFNTGKARRVLTTQIEEDDDSNATEEEEQHITSKKSYDAKIAELDEIINKHMPENTKDIATAREHGDLRENAEYAAAKERQKYLSERRAMLEMGIMSTIPTDFSDTIIEDRIIAGCSVTLKYEDQNEEVFHILGAWDSDPAKKYVSYNTGMGKVLVAKKVTDVVKLPDGTKCTIAKVESLSDKIKADLI